MNVTASADLRGSGPSVMTNTQTVDITNGRVRLRSTTRVLIRVYRVDRFDTVTRDRCTATAIAHPQGETLAIRPAACVCPTHRAAKAAGA